MFKKPEYPKVLEAYIETFQQDFLSNRQLVRSKIEEDNFVQRVNKNRVKKITEGKLNWQDCKQLTVGEILVYNIPKWGFLLFWLVWTIATIWLTAYLDKC